MEKGQGDPLVMTDPAPPYTEPPAGFDMGGYQGCPPTAIYSVQPAYQYSQQQPQIIHPVNPVVMVQQLPTEAPGYMMCPRCETVVLSEIKYIYSLCTWMTCGILGVCMCWPCCLIPFCVDAIKDVEHSCPECHTVLYVYQRG